MKAHGRAPEHQHDQPARKVARPGHAGWHDRATVHGRAMGGAAGVMLFRDFLFRESFHSAFFSFFPLVLRV